MISLRVSKTLMNTLLVTQGRVNQGQSDIKTSFCVVVHYQQPWFTPRTNKAIDVDLK
jgi:hypothetical protein